MLESLPNKGMPATFLERDSSTGVFSVNIAKFLRTPILKNIYERLLLKVQSGRFVGLYRPYKSDYGHIITRINIT